MRQRCANCGWLSVNPSGAMFCGYSDERTWEDEICMAWKDKDEPQTNADALRAMTDEELADEVLRWFNWLNAVEWDDNRILDWLKTEVTD